MSQGINRQFYGSKVDQNASAYEGLQAVVANSKFTLWAEELCKARHEFAKLREEVASNYPGIQLIQRNFLR